MCWQWREREREWANDRKKQCINKSDDQEYLQEYDGLSGSVGTKLCVTIFCELFLIGST